MFSCLHNQQVLVVMRMHKVLSCCTTVVVPAVLNVLPVEQRNGLTTMLDVTCKLTHAIQANVHLFQQQNLATLLDAQACLLLMDPNQSMSVHMKRVLLKILDQHIAQIQQSLSRSTHVQKITPVQQLAHAHHTCCHQIHGGCHIMQKLTANNLPEPVLYRYIT